MGIKVIHQNVNMHYIAGKCVSKKLILHAFGSKHKFVQYCNPLDCFHIKIHIIKTIPIF